MWSQKLLCNEMEICLDWNLIEAYIVLHLANLKSRQWYSTYICLCDCKQIIYRRFCWLVSCFSANHGRQRGCSTHQKWSQYPLPPPPSPPPHPLAEHEKTPKLPPLQAKIFWFSGSPFCNFLHFSRSLLVGGGGWGVPDMLMDSKISFFSIATTMWKPDWNSL